MHDQGCSHIVSLVNFQANPSKVSFIFNHSVAFAWTEIKCFFFFFYPQRSFVTGRKRRRPSNGGLISDCRNLRHSRNDSYIISAWKYTNVYHQFKRPWMKLAYLFHYLYYLKIIRLLWNFLIMLVRVKFAYLFKAIHVHKCKCIIDMTYDIYKRLQN